MGRRSRRWWNIIGKMWDAIMDNMSESIPVESRLRSDAEQMLEALDLKADATSFSMARADEVRARLQTELENHEGLGRQAEQFLRTGDEEAAQRCVTLQLASAKEVLRLKNEYAALQQEAEATAAAFLAKKREVDSRVAELPRLQEDARMIEMQERVSRMTDQLSLDTAQTSFDGAARELRIRKSQLANRQMLTADPNAELDERIRRSLGEQEIAQAMAALRQRIAQTAGAAPAQLPAGDDVTAAQKLLEAPRYQGILSLPSRVPEREPVPVPAKRKE